MARATPEQRFWQKVDKTEGCWNWEGVVLNNGYGQFYVNYTQPLAHRWSYALHYGEIPPGKVLDHLCRNRRCVRPDHLEAVTQRENVLRGEGLTAKLYAATHCVNGHEFTEANTRERRGGRDCRTCKNRRQREYTARKLERSN